MNSQPDKFSAAMQQYVLNLGRAIRELRRGRFSLDELGQEAGVSTGLLSNLENGRGNPTLRVLTNVAEALGVELDELAVPQTPRSTVLVRESDRKVELVPGSQQPFRLLTPDRRRRFTLTALTLASGEEFAASRHFVGTMLIYVVSGCHTVELTGSSVDVESGCSLQVESHSLLAHRNSGAVPAESYFVFLPESDMAAIASTETRPGEAEESTWVRAVGSQVRRFRGQRMSLTELARRSGVSVSVLSRLENGTGNPSLRVLDSISSALEVPVNELLRRVPDDNFTLLRPADRIRYATGFGAPECEALTSELQGDFLVYRASLDPGFRQMFPQAQPGDVTVLVQMGEVEVHVDDEVHSLDAGDAVTFDASRAHWMRNLTENGFAEVLVTMAPPYIAARSGIGGGGADAPR